MQSPTAGKSPLNRLGHVSQCAGALAKAMLGAAALSLTAASPVAAQDVESFDPDEAYAAVEQAAEASGAIDADLANPASVTSASATPAPANPTPLPTAAPLPAPATGAGADEALAGFDDEFSRYTDPSAQAAQDEVLAATDDPVANGAGAEELAANQADTTTYGQDDLIGAAEGVFGKGAAGLAGLIEDLLREQGEPNGYIVGREAGGAFIFGARYGSGTLYHKVEGQRQVYWTGPSLGPDAGANAGNTFVLVYNLYDSEDLYRRYPAGEGQAYFVGGLHASYMRRGDVVLIPIRMGAGLRLGVNAGYMRFSKKQRWLPF